jgi:hypothetical protein
VKSDGQALLPDRSEDLGHALFGVRSGGTKRFAG